MDFELCVPALRSNSSCYNKNHASKDKPAWKPKIGVVHFWGVAPLHVDHPDPESHFPDAHSESKAKTVTVFSPHGYNFMTNVTSTIIPEDLSVLNLNNF